MLHVIHLKNILHLFLNLGNADVRSSGLGTSVLALGAVLDTGAFILSLSFGLK